MAFMEFTNRSVQYPFRRKLTLVAGTTDVYEITRTGVQGTVFEEGVMFNEANMGEMQDEIVNYVEGTVLWTNSSPTSSFAGQTVTLSEAIENFTKYEIEYANTNTATSEILNTGKIKYNRKTIMGLNVDNHVYRRYVSSISGTSVVFSDCTGNVLNPMSALTSNTRVIPLQIIGYK